jgi:hypothetical protein
LVLLCAIHLGAIYEKNVTTGVTRTYYFAGSQRIAMRVEGDPVPANNGVFYFVVDHLGSTSLTLDASGRVATETLAYTCGNQKGVTKSG